jgi:hypothetical protein
MDTVSLADAARTHIECARAAVHGRSAHGGHDRVVQQPAIGPRAGATLREPQLTGSDAAGARGQRAADRRHTGAGTGGGRPPHGSRRGPRARRRRGLGGTAHRRAGPPGPVTATSGASPGYSGHEGWE